MITPQKEAAAKKKNVDDVPLWLQGALGGLGLVFLFNSAFKYIGGTHAFQELKTFGLVVLIILGPWIVYILSGMVGIYLLVAFIKWCWKHS